MFQGNDTRGFDTVFEDEPIGRGSGVAYDESGIYPVE
jgi:hypothetical protein